MLQISLPVETKIILCVCLTVQILRRATWPNINNGGAEIARPDIGRPDKAAPDQTARLHNRDREQTQQSKPQSTIIIKSY